MELKIVNGDYVPDGGGGFVRVEGAQALLQRVMFRLTARRGALPFLDTLGSRLWQLGQLPPGERAGAAKQYAAEALAPEEGVRVTDVDVEGADGACALTVHLAYGGQALSVGLEVR